MSAAHILRCVALAAVCAMLPAVRGMPLWVQAKAQQTAPPNLDAALFAAAERGEAEAVGALLRKKADVDARDARGFTPLGVAASLGHTPVVVVLLKAGADADAQTRSGSTPLFFAAFGGHTETIAALLRARAAVNHRTPDGITALMMAANAGHAAAITQLTQAGTHIDAADNAGRTALMLAAAKGHVAAVQALVKAGANVHLANQWGDTALTWAANEGHTAAVDALLAAGANVEAKNKVGATALLMAARGGFLPMIAPLLKAGARTDAADENGRTALMFAAFNGHTDVLKALLAAKAAPNTADHKGQTALMHAATQGHAPAVAALLAAGADANAATSNGSTALMSAAFWGRRDAVATLLAAGADPALRDSADNTAADLARDAGHANLRPLFAAAQRKTPDAAAPTPSPEAGASGLGAKPTPTPESLGSKPTPTPEAPSSKPTPTPEAPASGLRATSAGVGAKTLPRFEDVTAQAGIHFTHTNGATPEKYIPETMGSGGLFFDYDNDGWLDIFLVNGGSIADPEISKRARYPLYHNNRDGTFTDVTARSGIAPLRYGMGACAADYDNDGWTDLYLTGFQGNALYRNNGGQRESTRGGEQDAARDSTTFTNVTAEARAAVHSWSTSCAWADFDKDGHLDLYIVNYVDFSLAKNLFCGDTVQRVRAYCHPHAYTGLDDVLLRNNGDGTFTDISKPAGIAGVAGPRSAKGLGVVVGDYDNDGWPDIYVANDSVPNFLWRNRGRTAGILPASHERQRTPGDTTTPAAVPAKSRQDARATVTFEDVAQWAGAAVSGQGRPEAGMGTDIADVDNDGLLDLFVTNLDLETVTFYRNLGKGMFADTTDELGLGQPSSPYVGWGAAFFDFDNDGRLDIAVANGNVLDNASFFRQAATYAQPKLLFHNDGARFTEVGAAAGPGFALVKVGRGLATGDYDNDGDLDLLITNNGQSADLLRNDGGNRSPSLVIRLVGTRSNRDAVGARLTLTTGDTRQLREVKAGSSYLAQNDPRIHFGLGSATRIDKLEIRWPSGTVEAFEKLDAKQILTIVEGKGITARAPFRAPSSP